VARSRSHWILLRCLPGTYALKAYASVLREQYWHVPATIGFQRWLVEVLFRHDFTLHASQPIVDRFSIPLMEFSYLLPNWLNSVGLDFKPNTVIVRLIVCSVNRTHRLILSPLCLSVLERLCFSSLNKTRSWDSSRWWASLPVSVAMLGLGRHWRSYYWQTRLVVEVRCSAHISSVGDSPTT